MDREIILYQHSAQVFRDMVHNKQELEILLSRGKEFLKRATIYTQWQQQDFVLTVWDEGNSELIGVISDDANGITVRMFKELF